MPLVASEQIQIGIIEEVTVGVTPLTPAFQLVRADSESLGFSPQTLADDELVSTGRTSYPADIVGMTIQGSINFTLKKAPWLELVFGGVFGSNWGLCPVSATGLVNPDTMVVGRTLRTFTIEKRWPDPVTAGQFLYQRFRGCTFSSLSLSVAPNQKITGSVTVVGGSPEIAVATIAGATYVTAGQNPSFTAPKVVGIDVGVVLGMGTHCWNQLTLNFDSQNRGIPCIGTTGDREVVLGTLNASISGTIYLVDQTILSEMLANNTVGDAVVTFSDGVNVYKFQFFDVRPTQGSASSGGKGQDVTIPLTLEPTPALVCSDLVTLEEWVSSIVMGRVDFTLL